MALQQVKAAHDRVRDLGKHLLQLGADVTFQLLASHARALQLLQPLPKGIHPGQMRLQPRADVSVQLLAPPSLQLLQSFLERVYHRRLCLGEDLRDVNATLAAELLLAQREELTRLRPARINGQRVQLVVGEGDFERVRALNGNSLHFQVPDRLLHAAHLLLEASDAGRGTSLVAGAHVLLDGTCALEGGDPRLHDLHAVQVVFGIAAGVARHVRHILQPPKSGPDPGVHVDDTRLQCVELLRLVLRVPRRARDRAHRGHAAVHPLGDSRTLLSSVLRVWGGARWRSRRNAAP
mmetsp:Transcript_39289/g.113632  ORF Transcript_39289/g.113632 Transcript_39289/m.113632 type:complete len:293 (-) Transcript_39289:98-976(-)